MGFAGGAFPGGFREYMQVKRRKLEIQGQEVAVAGSQSNVLQGIVIYFNGYTGTSELTMIQLKELVLVHGARVRDKLEPDVTHIVATQMTDSKINQLRKPVVTPAWLLDSIQQQKLLPWIQYRLYSGLAPTQKTLADYATTSDPPLEKPPASSEDANEELGLHLQLSDGESSEEEAAIPDWAEGYFGKGRLHVDMNSEWVKANVSTAPGFLQKYFNSSRLHHLSTWKSELRDFVADQARSKRKKDRPTSGPRTIMHVDMDCFFASISIRDRPELRNVPVAVAHSPGTSNKSTSELASCNYAAREYGIRNGMSIGRARELCKDLRVVPYEFDKYDAASKALYAILIDTADEVQAVSVDEAYIDVSSLMPKTSDGSEIKLAEDLRARVLDATGCPASIGIGPNMLLARLATKKAKPNGSFFVPQEDVATFMSELRIRDLPGVGYALRTKMEAKNITTCRELAQLSSSALQRDCGEKIGQTLYNNCRGIDNRPLENKPRQSVGAEINWGMRFQNYEQVNKFVRELSEEVVKRMRAASVKGKHLTLKLKKKRYQGEPQKVLGCGDCDNLSRSVKFAQFIDAVDIVSKEGIRMVHELNVGADEIRGLGLHFSSLEAYGDAYTSTDLKGQRRLDFGPAPVADAQSSERQESTKKGTPAPKRSNDLLAQFGIKPGEVDWDVLMELPEDIRAELLPLLEERASAATPTKATALYIAHQTPPKNNPRVDKANVNSFHMLPTASQVDPEVMRALPESIRKEMEAAISRANASGRAGPIQRPNAKRGTKGRGAKFSPTKGQLRFDQMIPEVRDNSTDLAMKADTVPEPSPPPTLGGLQDVEAIREMLGAWVEHFRNGPEPDDVLALKTYFETLVEDLELEKVDALLSWLGSKIRAGKRSDKGKGNGAWAEASEELMDSVKNAVKARYGCDLKSATVDKNGTHNYV